MSSRDLFLAIDVGTGSVRFELVDANGNLAAFHAKEHAADRVAACDQMHTTVLIDQRTHA